MASRPGMYVRQTYCMLGLALLQQSATSLSMAGAVTRPITLPAHAVSECSYP